MSNGERKLFNVPGRTRNNLIPLICDDVCGCSSGNAIRIDIHKISVKYATRTYIPGYVNNCAFVEVNLMP